MKTAQDKQLFGFLQQQVRHRLPELLAVEDGPGEPLPRRAVPVRRAGLARADRPADRSSGSPPGGSSRRRTSRASRRRRPRDARHEHRNHDSGPHVRHSAAGVAVTVSPLRPRRRRDGSAAAGFLILAILLVGFVFFYPIVAVILTSLQDPRSGAFVGMTNYGALFADEIFQDAVRQQPQAARRPAGRGRPGARPRPGAVRPDPRLAALPGADLPAVHRPGRRRRAGLRPDPAAERPGQRGASVPAPGLPRPRLAGRPDHRHLVVGRVWSSGASWRSASSSSSPG